MTGVEYQSEELVTTDAFLMVLYSKHVSGRICRTEEQLKANAWELHEQNPEGLLGRWDFSAGAPTSYIEDGTNSDHELLMHISKYDSWNATEFPMSRFGEAPIEVPFK